MENKKILWSFVFGVFFLGVLVLPSVIAKETINLDTDSNELAFSDENLILSDDSTTVVSEDLNGRYGRRGYGDGYRFSNPSGRHRYGNPSYYGHGRGRGYGRDGYYGGYGRGRYGHGRGYGYGYGKGYGRYGYGHGSYGRGYDGYGYGSGYGGYGPGYDGYGYGKFGNYGFGPNYGFPPRYGGQCGGIPTRYCVKSVPVDAYGRSLDR